MNSEEQKTINVIIGPKLSVFNDSLATINATLKDISEELRKLSENLIKSNYCMFSSFLFV